jgi:hypothetical protein
MNYFDGRPESQATGSRDQGSDSLRKAMQARVRETSTMAELSEDECLFDPAGYCAPDR